jgi:hypothetical protein
MISPKSSERFSQIAVYCLLSICMLSVTPRQSYGSRVGVTHGALQANVLMTEKGRGCFRASYGAEEALKDTDEALAYLSRSAHARGFFARLNEAAAPVTIVINRCDENHLLSKDDAASAAITWDPHQALIDTGGRQSPALGLLHELVHAMHQIEDPRALVAARSQKCGNFDTCEERRTILYGENPVAEDLGEALRIDHYGEDREVRRSTSSR